MSKQIFLVPLLLQVFILAGCQSSKSPAPKSGSAPKATPSRSFERNDPSVPFLAVRLYYGGAGTARKLAEVQDDFSERFRGMRRVGDGILSVGVRDGRGRWVESYECGGHLFVTGIAGQPCQIVLRNESKSRLEIVAGMDGRDATSGGVFKLDTPGIVLSPMQTVVIGKVKRKKPAALRFGAGRAASAGPVIETALKPSAGSILLAVFQEKDRFPWEWSSFHAHKNLPGKYPQPAYEAEPMAHEYR